MISKSFWQRLFGHSAKKTRAQAAFQEQFDTKLQFRELEPRVVLAADAIYDSVGNTLTITVEDGDSVEIGRDGMDNFLFVDGLTSSSGDGVFAGGKLTLDTTTLTSITITDTDTNNSAVPSMVTFLASLSDGTDLDLTTSFTTLDNVDSVSVEVGSEVRVGLIDFLSTGTNTDDSTVSIDGLIIGDVNVDASNSSGKSLSVTSSASGSVTAPSFTINRDATAGAVDIDLGLGTHDLDTLSQSSTSDEVSIDLTDADEIELGDIVASEITVVAGGAIQDTAATHMEVSGAAFFDGTEVKLNSSVAGHDFSSLTLNTSVADAKVAETNGFAFDGTNSIAGNLAIESGGAITQAGGTLTVAGSSNFTVADNANLTLDKANDFVGEISVVGETGHAGTATINDDSGGLTLGSIHAKVLDVASAGAILQGSGELDVTTTSDFVAGGAITLETATNQFAGAVTADSSGFGTSLADTDAIILGDITSSSLKVNAGGSITQVAATKILTGTADLTSTGGTITLTNVGNDFTGSFDADGAIVSVTDSTAIELGEISATQLTVNAGGAISQTVGEHVVVSGETSLTATGFNITLSNSDNDFGGSVDVTGSKVTLADTNAIELGEMSATDLTVNAGDAITQSASEKVVVTGETFLSATASTIALTNSDNNFGGSVDASGTTISLTDINAIELGEIASSKLTINAGGAITQTAGEKVVVSGLGASSFTSTGTITLENSANDFTGAVSASGSNVSLVDANAIQLGNITANSLTVIASMGDITQAGGTSLDIAGTTLAKVVDSFDVTLFNAGNDFTGAVSIDGINALDVPNEVKLQDVNGIVLGNIDANSLEVSAGGLISQLGGTTLTVPAITLTSNDAITLGNVAATTLSLSVGDAISQAVGTSVAISGTTEISVDDGVNVTLFNLGNDFGGAVSVLGNSMGDVSAAVMVKDVNALILGDIAADSLSVMAGGDVTQAVLSKLDIETTTEVMTDNGFNVILFNSGNDFGGTVTVTGNLAADVLNKVQIRDVNELTLGNIRANEFKLDVGSDIDQQAATTILAGATTITVSDGGDVTLFNAGNEFSGTVSITSPGMGNAAGDVKLMDVTGLELGDIVGNSLELEVNGDVSQAIATTLDIAQETNIRVGNTANVTLFNDGNEFVGAVSVTGIGLLDLPDSVMLKDANALILGDVVAKSLDIAAGVDVTQAVTTTLDIEMSTTVVTADGAQVILFNEGNDFRGVVSAVGNAATDTLSKVMIRDDAAKLGLALTLGDVRSDALTVRAEGSVNQLAGSKLLVGNTTDVSVANGGDVVLFNANNDFGGVISILGIDPVADTPGDVSIRDDVADGSNIALMLGEIKATSLDIKAAGTITQPNDGSTKIVVTTGSTDLELTAKGDIDLRFSDNDIFTDTGLGKDFTVTLGGVLSNLENIYLRNVSVGAIIPSGDLPIALAGGTMGNVTFDFPNSPAVDLSAIKITGELNVLLDGDLTQSGNIFVGQNATFDAGSIVLAETNDLIVVDNASFTTDKGNIEVGVASTPLNAFTRGTPSGTDTAFGTITFSAFDFGVTIAEGSPGGDANPGMNLAGDNGGASVVLTSSKGIETDASSSLTVSGLSSFYAQAGSLQLGNGTDEAVDLRIVYAEASGNISIYEQADTNGLMVIDGTQANAILAMKSDGPIIQVNDFRSGAVFDNHITANQAVFHSGSGVLLTSLDVDVLAGSADGTPLFVTPGAVFDIALAGLDGTTGLGGNLTTDVIDADLPDENSDKFAAGARADSFVDGVGENYSFIAVNDGNLTIAKVSDPLGDIGEVNGIETNGAIAGHVFLRTTNSGDLAFGAAGSSPIIVDMTNSGVITALASGNLTITDGFSLHSSKGAGGVGDLFAVVSKIVEFDDMNLPPPNTPFEIDDPASWGPAYVRITGTVDTYLLDTSTGFDSEAIYVLAQLGEAGEMDFVLVTDWRQSSMPPEPAVLDFENIVAIEFAENIDAPTNIVFFYPWEFATTHASVNIAVSAYNSPQINLYENVDAMTPTNLNVVNDSFRMYFNTPIDNVPLMEAFVPPPAPFVAPVPMEVAQAIISNSIIEISGDSRVATPIDGVTVVEVNPNDLDLTIGDEIKLDGEFMTLDAVKELIQRDERFRPGLYRIAIVYPGVEQPQISYYEKHIRATPEDIFGKSPVPTPPKAEALVAGEKRESQLSPEEVWAREYDKWFPSVLIERVHSGGEQPAPGEADVRQGMIPTEDQILVDRVSMIDLTDIEQLADRMRAKRIPVRETLNGVMLGGTFLMAAAASRQNFADEQAKEFEEEKVLPEDAKLNGNSRDRLRRRMRQWL